MNFRHVLSACLIGTALLAAGPATAELLGKNAMTSTETIGPAAKGGAKPYQATAEAECANTVCAASFGKKAKARKVRLISCVMIGPEAPQIAAVFFESEIQFYVPVASVAPLMAGTIGTFTSDFEFEIPAGVRMQVRMQADGDPTLAACTATGSLL